MLLELVFCLISAVSILPGAILLVEVLASVLPIKKPHAEADTSPPRTAVLIPAHDEVTGIAATVRSLAPELGPSDRLIVIADNCTDNTAALARAAGAAVIERRDPERRGKGFAIAFGLGHLDADPPEVVVLVDADCRVSGGGIHTLARLAIRHGRPVQAEYLIGASPASSPIAVISALAVLLRNRVRPRGLHKLGLPCHLTGSGMAFPWHVLRDAPETGANLVEDLVMGLEMSLRGHAPLWCPKVEIKSELPDGRKAATSQRRRWEHGQLHTLMTYVPRLLLAGLRRGRPELLGLGLDLLVPPLALLATLQVGLLALTGTAGALGLTTLVPAALAVCGAGAVAAAVAVAWLRFGRQTIPLRYVLFIPLYVLWKVPLYLSLLVRGKQRTWERTARLPQRPEEETEGSSGPSQPL